MAILKRPFIPDPKALEARGRAISDRFAERMGPIIDILEAKRIPGVRHNANDKTWLTDRNAAVEDSEFLSGAMKGRPSFLARMDDDFRALGRIIWNEGTVIAAADLLLPLLDISERTCFGYYGHQHRTMQYAEIVLGRRSASERPMPDAEAAAHLLGALMHDIGKAAVPGEVLRIKGELGGPEKELINLHPGYGKSILLAAFASLAEAGNPMAYGDVIIDIAFSHHEKYGDTGGYPAGIRGTDISVGGRITGFCDALDSMTTDRIYDRKPKTFARAKAIALSELNLHFNASIVMDFLDAVEPGKAGETAPDTGVKERVFDIIRSAGGKPE
jgi:HD-GYP domain-containing protein (c-di-GMP phosphodiesterase class II)